MGKHLDSRAMQALKTIVYEPEISSHLLIIGSHPDNLIFTSKYLRYMRIYITKENGKHKKKKLKLKNHMITI